MMKKWWVVITAALLLSGCSTPAAYETVSDELLMQTLPEAQQVSVILPADASAVVLENDEGKIWLCGDYTVCTQTLASGDLEQTLRTVTGLDKEALDLVKLDRGDHIRYECAWVCAGEGGDQMNRAVVLDDGNYHYVLTLHTDAQKSGQLSAAWKQITGLFDVNTAP